MTTKNQIELVDGRQKIKENKERERERERERESQQFS